MFSRQILCLTIFLSLSASCKAQVFPADEGDLILVPLPGVALCYVAGNADCSRVLRDLPEEDLREEYVKSCGGCTREQAQPGIWTYRCNNSQKTEVVLMNSSVPYVFTTVAGNANEPGLPGGRTGFVRGASYTCFTKRFCYADCIKVNGVPQCIESAVPGDVTVLSLNLDGGACIGGEVVPDPDHEVGDPLPSKFPVPPVVRVP